MMGLYRKILAGCLWPCLWLALVAAGQAAESNPQSSGAKDLFYRQLAKPGQNLNLGLEYSIELTRAGKKFIVDSRFPFVSQDEIRFRIRPNIDGFMYIVLKEGASGNRTVLFPVEGRGDSNQVKRGQEYLLPEDGALVFDDKTGIESLQLILSRQELPQQPLEIAAGRGIVIRPRGSQQTVDQDCLLAFSDNSHVDKIEDLPGTTGGAGAAYLNPAMTMIRKDANRPLVVEMQLQHGPAAELFRSPSMVQQTSTSMTAKETLDAALSPAAKPSGTPAADTPLRDKWALVIGISKFKDSSLNLPFPEKDARDFAQFLITDANFASDHVKVLCNQEATREHILTELGNSWLPKNVCPGDLVLLYIATHGTSSTIDVAKKNFLVAYDTNKSNAFATGIELQDLARTIKRRLNTDRLVIILDTCHSGSAEPGAKALGSLSFNIEDLAQGTGQVVIASAHANQKAHDSLRFQNGVFTRHFIDGLRLHSKLHEAFAYTKAHVEEESLKDFQKLQTPVIKDGEWQGRELQIKSPAFEPRTVVSSQ